MADDNKPGVIAACGGGGFEPGSVQGTPPTDDGKCPKCGCVELCRGYGLAFGGIGAYTFCDNDQCDWYYKVQDSE